MGLISSLGARFKADIVGRFAAIIAGGLLTVILARLLSPNEYGLLFLAISVLSIFEVFSKLGIGKSAGRYVSQFKESKPRQVTSVIIYSLLTNIILIFIVIIVVYLGSSSLSNYLGEPDMVIYLKIGSLFIIGSSLVAYFKFVAQGFEAIAVSSIINSSNHVGRLLFSVIFIFLGYGALGALLGFIVAAFIASGIGLIILYIGYLRHYQFSLGMDSQLYRRIMEYSIPLASTDIAGQIDSRIDTILVGFFLNPVSVSYYVISKQIIHFVGVPASAVGFSISPTYSTKKVEQDLDTAARMYEESMHYTLLLYVPAAVGMLIIADPAITLIFGDEYSGAIPVLQVLSLYAVLQAITKITDHPLDYLGRAKEKAVAYGITAIGNVALNILLIPRIGVVGAAIATLVTHAFYVAVKLYVIGDELPIKSIRIAKSVGLVVIATSPMAISVWYLANYISGFIGLTLLITLGVVIWLISSLGVGAINHSMIREAILS